MHEKYRPGERDTVARSWGQAGQVRVREPCVPLTGWQWSQVSGEFPGRKKKFCESHRKWGGGCGGGLFRSHHWLTPRVGPSWRASSGAR